MNNQMALHCIQHLMETDAIQASKNAETYKRALRDGKLNSSSLQGKEGYYFEKLHLSFHSTEAAPIKIKAKPPIGFSESRLELFNTCESLK